jgi:hypothetical protein
MNAGGLDRRTWFAEYMPLSYPILSCYRVNKDPLNVVEDIIDQCFFVEVSEW